jgi:uncharacterized protein
MSTVLLVLAGFAAGFMNVLAGGGSFVTLPALIAVGLSALGANASSTVALFPAQLASAALARSGLAVPATAGGISLRGLAVVALVGGFAGAVLLLVTPPDLFLAVVPWLVLFATAVFARGDRVLASGVRFGTRGIYAAQAVVSIYGGYFGGGIGILMLAALTLFGFTDIRSLNKVKIVLAMLTNVAAVLVFTAAGLVRWQPTLVLGAAALCGSLVGMAALERVPARVVRGFVIVVGLVLAAAFFLRRYA